MSLGGGSEGGLSVAAYELTSVPAHFSVPVQRGSAEKTKMCKHLSLTLFLSLSLSYTHTHLVGLPLYSSH